MLFVVNVIACEFVHCIIMYVNDKYDLYDYSFVHIIITIIIIIIAIITTVIITACHKMDCGASPNITDNLDFIFRVKTRYTNVYCGPFQCLCVCVCDGPFRCVIFFLLTVSFVSWVSASLFHRLVWKMGWCWFSWDTGG